MSQRNRSGNQRKQIRKYIFLGGLVFIGILFGIVFSLILSKGDKLLVTHTIEEYFANPSIKKSSMIEHFKLSLSSHFFYMSLVWILGMSIIGMPIILFALFGKGFIFGFSFGSILRVYHIKGILGVIGYMFPHSIFSLLFSLLLTFHAMNMSIKLFRYLFFKKEMNVKQTMRQYVKILCICMIGYFCCSLMEGFLSPYIVQFISKIL